MFAESAQLSSLERLQQARLRSRLADLAIDLRPPWPRRAIAASACAALAIFALAALWTSPPRLAPATEPAARTAATASATTLAQVELAIAPPAYTGLPARREASLEAKAPEGARLRWRLRFAPQPTAAAPTPLAPAAAGGGDWMVQLSATKSEADARRSFADAQRRYSALSGRPLDVQRADLGARGTYYRARVPAGSREAAAALCSQIQSQGGQCMVTRR